MVIIKKYKNIYVISETCKKAYNDTMDINPVVLNCPTDNDFYEYYDKSSHVQYSKKLLMGDKPTVVLVYRMVD